MHALDLRVDGHTGLLEALREGMVTVMTEDISECWRS